MQGNDAYKKRNFAKAKECYIKASEIDPDELIYYTNLGAVFFEEKNFDACIEACDRAIAKSKGSDKVKLGKALGRKANALL